MIEQEVVGALSAVGFPAFAFILMYKLATDTIKENSTAIGKLNEAIIRLCEKEDKEV
jgi:hypothetical protein